MTAILTTSDTSSRFERTNLAEGFNENWLQQLIFSEPDLLPLDKIEAGSGKLIPICRELSIPKPGGNVFLDILGITSTGRPVLIECKLWRNPQARREVIAQILEYAALLRRWSYADLTARVKARTSWGGDNPIYAQAAASGSPLGEVEFTDSLARNLRNGDFHLVIAGDGIREDMLTIAEHIGDKGTQLALVEFQRWTNAEGHQLIIPHIPFKTEVVRQRLLFDQEQNVIQIQSSDHDAEATLSNGQTPEQASIREQNRNFWQAFIDNAEFDHPDQGRPRHGGNNWVKIPLPYPAKWITAYRAEGRAGLFLVEEIGSELVSRLHADLIALQKEFGPEPLRLKAIRPGGAPAFAVDEPDGTADQLQWVIDVANRLVNVLRPRLAPVY